MAATVLQQVFAAARRARKKALQFPDERAERIPEGDPSLLPCGLLRCVWMDSRSVLRSPPAVAGLVLLALVVGVIFAMRSTMNARDTTDVAGTVIERSEEPSEPVDVTAAPEDTEAPLIVRPRPDPPRDEPDPLVEQDPPPPAPVEPEEEPVGLIRDPDAPVVIADPAPDRGPARNRDRDPQPDREPEPEPEPDPEPTRRPAPDPEPEPEPEPQPEPEPDTTRYELREGEGVSTERAYSDAPGNSGNYNWDFVSLASHHDQDGQVARSRKSMARLFVGFSAATKASTEPVRDFRCDVLVTAGSRRLITDRDHFFEIQLWTTDGYKLQELVSSVFVREAMDLAAGEERTLRGTNVPDRAAAEGLGYICTAEYRER